MHTNAYASTLDSNAYSELKCVSNQLEVRENDDYKMQNSSPMSDRAGVSILYNDSGYHTNIHPDPTSFSSNSNSNSEPSFETSEEISLHSRPLDLTSLHGSNHLYFCDDAVFDEPKLVGPPLLCDNTNNYEEFSSLIKFSLEDTSSNYLNNDINMHSSALPILHQFEDNLCSLTSVQIYQSQNSFVAENSIISQSVQENVLLIGSETSDNSNSSIVSIQRNLELNVEESQQSTSSSSNYSNSSNILNNLNIKITTSLPVETNSNFVNSEVLAQNECNTNSTINYDGIINNYDNLSSPTCHTPSNSYKNNVTSDMSPELFSEAEDEPPIHTTSSFCAANMSHISTLPKSCSQLLPEYENTLRNDRKLLKRVHETLSGVPPPPSVTILQMSVSEMLDKINSNKQFFFDQPDKITSEETASTSSMKSLLINTNKEKTLKTDWKEILQLRFHGLQ